IRLLRYALYFRFYFLHWHFSRKMLGRRHRTDIAAWAEVARPGDESYPESPCVRGRGATTRFHRHRSRRPPSVGRSCLRRSTPCRSSRQSSRRRTPPVTLKKCALLWARVLG